MICLNKKKENRQKGLGGGGWGDDSRGSLRITGAKGGVIARACVIAGEYRCGHPTIRQALANLEDDDEDAD